ncbi:MAG: two-component regulator propeller domain-containing protein [Paludibacter sp.]
MKIRILFAGLILTSCLVPLQAQLAMGKWRTHFAYNSVNQIAQSEHKVFAISAGALFSVDKKDQDIELYSKLNGLSDNNISRIEYDSENKQLLIVYNNGNIDLLSSSGVINIPDLYNKQMSTSKTINQIMINDDKAYLSCDFGILVLNMNKHEVADTYYIGDNGSDVKVLNTAIQGSYLYAISSNTIYKSLLSEPNLANYEFWSTLSGLPGNGEFKKIASFGGKLVLMRGNKLYAQNENQIWSPLFSEISVSDFFVLNNNKMIITDNGTTSYLVDEVLNLTPIENMGLMPDAEFDSERNLYWFAGKSEGVVSYNIETSEVNSYKPGGPIVNIPWEMTFSQQKLFVVQGGRWAIQDNKPGYVMIYENNIWTNLDPTIIKNKTGYDALDFMNIAVDPLDDKHFFVTSYGTGLYEFKNDAFVNWYNHLNSTLETVIANNPYRFIRLDGAIFDQDGNLLLANIGVNAAIKVLLKDGTWTQLTYPEAAKPTLGRILISNQNPNQKWVPSVRYSPGILIFDDNGTITDQSDDQSVFKSSFVFPETENGQTVLISETPAYVYTIVQDKSGTVWVGTDLGPFLFYNTSKIFDPDYTCTRVKIPRNDDTGLADYLLKDEKIKAIAIDGANRKWLGTETSGVYLMSENGQETIQHFTVSNSPLLSNDILSIAISPVTGEVFFGTGNGLVSYQSNAVDGGDTFNNVHAYPNPVRENFTGVITITGLIKDTQVKITDLNGNLICQTVSNGGIATWDGKDVRGRKVSTGIYLAICVNEDGTQSTITKIMVIN